MDSAVSHQIPLCIAYPISGVGFVLSPRQTHIDDLQFSIRRAKYTLRKVHSIFYFLREVPHDPGEEFERTSAMDPVRLIVNLEGVVRKPNKQVPPIVQLFK